MNCRSTTELHSGQLRQRIDQHLRGIVAELKLPPIAQLTEDGVIQAVENRVVTTQRNDSSRAGEVGDEQLRDEVHRVVQEIAKSEWERLAAMLTGRARVQLSLMSVPGHLEAPEDMAQLALAKAHENQDQFRGSSPAEYRAWVKSILDRLLIDRARGLCKGQRAQLRTTSVDEQCEKFSTRGGLQLADSQVLRGSEVARRQEAVDLLFEAIEKLPPDERRIVAAKLAERTFDEISRDIGVPKTTVVRRYHTALAFLRQTLEGLA